MVYHRCSLCDRAWIQGGDGPRGIPPAAVRKVEREAEAEAGVIHLEADGRVALGGCPPRAPPDPDVQDYRIRLLGPRFRCAA